MPIAIEELSLFFLEVMLTDSNFVVTNIYSSVKWYLLQNLIQPGKKNSYAPFLLYEAVRSNQ
jgi:hypothetical protein